MSAYTITTIHPRAHGHSDVREAQVRRDDGLVHVWLDTDKGRILIRDRHLLDRLTAALRRAGYGQEQQEIDATSTDHRRRNTPSEERAAQLQPREGAQQR